ncbi:Transcriptional regulator, contains XRE-family HTH domain [Micromonospora phaseoli]|uniref:Transcriptional regulator, contains XRE-family HTH domain n=1 Tax=Micromonospora phaseoli TaxID=1144548 RepID=A0A1H6RXN9_9ACTN|nr:helix-turn-helix transcriptional regulator [Micromonospora phaseoli]PZW03547.1 transcriptional regulator with XRE-family HTH domain [Micromonospora phaseoli]GIJ77113.1 hypothetical protein Xph01_15450 [Micromonospora phaseoli]SEI56305.1 Transcriptional regulator, contains XRE-family HTH domain [Micromonospora phaseoli]
MVLLRRVIGDALRARRQGQHRTLREVSSAANVSLGYLSEIERGQKEPSSELLAAICDALGARLSELLREVSDTVAFAEQLPGVLVPVQDEPADSPVAAPVHKATGRGVRQVTSDGSVAVSARQDSPLKATLRSARVRPATDRTDRDVVCAA